MPAPGTIRIALAQPPAVGSISDGLPWVERFIAEAAAGGADIVCFPETFIPGLRAVDFAVEPHDPAALQRALEHSRSLAERHRIQVILPMEWPGPGGLLNTAFILSAAGEIRGQQTKNQIAPEEDPGYVPGTHRTLFDVKGIPYGIVICHEGWQYPETVRWAAARGAPIVFHATLTGATKSGHAVKKWGAPDSPYYEKAMVCRALENGIFIASVNCALPFQEAATAVIAPDGSCIAHLPYGEPGLLVSDIEIAKADRLYARRLNAAALGEAENSLSTASLA
jgi:predicted amidohydrolase